MSDKARAQLTSSLQTAYKRLLTKTPHQMLEKTCRVSKSCFPTKACLCALRASTCLLETNWRKAWETFAAVANGWQTPRMETFGEQLGTAGKNLSTKPPTLAKKPFRAPKSFCHDRSSASALFFAPELASRKQLRTMGLKNTASHPSTLPMVDSQGYQKKHITGHCLCALRASVCLLETNSNKAWFDTNVSHFHPPLPPP